MHSTIESALASQYVEDRIRQADAVRQIRAMRRAERTDTRGRRWFRRSEAAVVTARAAHSGP
jgi:hypothetical protein